MASHCTLFSTNESDLQPAADITLPTYADASFKTSDVTHPHTLELGRGWQALHAAIGNHAGDNPLAFLVSGGETIVSLDDSSGSSGRYFAHAALLPILVALRKVTDRQVARAARSAASDLEEVRRNLKRLIGFVADTIAARNRGLIVHVFR